MKTPHLLFTFLIFIGLLSSCTIKDGEIRNAGSVLAENRFEQIEHSLTATTDSLQRKSRILYAQHSNEYKLLELKQASNSIQSYIDDYRKRMEDYINKEQTTTKNVKDYVHQTTFSVTLGNAYQLKEKLEAYVNSVNSIDEQLNAKQFALDANQIDAFKEDPDQKYKDFAQLNFGNTPLGAARAILAQIENEAARIELEAAKTLALDNN